MAIKENRGRFKFDIPRDGGNLSISGDDFSLLTSVIPHLKYNASPEIGDGSELESPTLDASQNTPSLMNPPSVPKSSEWMGGRREGDIISQKISDPEMQKK